MTNHDLKLYYITVVFWIILSYHADFFLNVSKFHWATATFVIIKADKAVIIFYQIAPES